jgi:oxygen-dependent protoporphyrinogen oxidase
MIGGARHPSILEKARGELVRLAVDEVRLTLHARGDPSEVFFASWPKGIPQYDRAYVAAEAKIAQELKRWPGLHLVANYRKGVSLNDCIENAYQAVNDGSREKRLTV